MHSDLVSTSSGRVFKIKHNYWTVIQIEEKNLKNGKILSLGPCLRMAVSPEAHVRVGDCSVSLQRSFQELTKRRSRSAVLRNLKNHKSELVTTEHMTDACAALYYF